MKKLFVSQPMNGRTDDEIFNTREHCIFVVKYILRNLDLNPQKLEVIDSYFRNAPTNANPLWYLGESLKKLAEADIAIFAKGWQHARGCRIEHEAAVAYGIEVLYE